MDCSIEAPTFSDMENESELQEKDAMNSSEFVANLSGIKRVQECEESETSPVSKKLRNEEIPLDIAVAPQVLSADVEAGDGVEPTLTFEQPTNSSNEPNAPLTGASIPICDQSGFKMPLMLMGGLPGGILPGIAQQPMVMNPGLALQATVPWHTTQFNHLPQTLQSVGQNRQQVQDPESEQYGNTASIMSQTQRLTTTEESNLKSEVDRQLQEANSTHVPTSGNLKLGQPEGLSTLQLPNSPNFQTVAWNSASSPDAAAQSQQQAEYQHSQAFSGLLPQNRMQIPTNQILYPQVFQNQTPVQQGTSVLPDADAASLATRNGILLSQFNPIADRMIPPLLNGAVGAQRNFSGPVGTHQIGIPLASSCDNDHLSEYQILVRKQLIIFEATMEDVHSGTQGRKKKVVYQQVGIQCRHCAGFPTRQRGRGAVYYPYKLQGIYQACQNMATSHLCESCQCIPPSMKQQLRNLREMRHTASGGKQYWAEAARAMGLQETANGLKLLHKGSPT